MQRFDAHGHTVGAMSTIFSDISSFNEVSSPFIIAHQDGSYAIGWNHYKSGSWNVTKLGFFDADDQSVGSTLTLDNQYHPSIAPLKNGGYAVGLASGSTLHLDIYDAEATRLVDNNVDSLTTWNWSSPDITALDDGGFAMSWRDGSGDEPLRLRFFDSDGTARGNEISFGFGFGFKQLDVVQLTSGDLMVVYEKDDDLIAQRFTLEGDLVGDLVTVNENHPHTEHYKADLIALDGGGFFVCWTLKNPMDKEVYGRYFDSLGRPLTNEILLNSTSLGSQFDSALTALANGNIQIVWTSSGSGGVDIYSRMLQLGHVISEEAQVGSVVGQVDARDAEDDNLTYTLLDDAGGLFAINSNTGVITLVGSLDDESQQHHTVKVQVADSQGATTESLIAVSVADGLQGAALSGPSYQMILEQGDDSLSLLAPVQVDGQLYYTLDKNQDNRIDDADRFDIAELSEFLANTDSVHFGDKVLTLPTQNALINAGLIDGGDTSDAVGFTFWAHSSEAANSLYSLMSGLPIDEDQMDALVVFQMIG